jgi:hypothetical protein
MPSRTRRGISHGDTCGSGLMAPGATGSPGDGIGALRSSWVSMSILARWAAGCQISSKGPATELPTRRPRLRCVNHANPARIAAKATRMAIAGRRSVIYRGYPVAGRVSGATTASNRTRRRSDRITTRVQRPRREPCRLEASAISNQWLRYRRAWATVMCNQTLQKAGRPWRSAGSTHYR